MLRLHCNKPVSEEIVINYPMQHQHESITCLIIEQDKVASFYCFSENEIKELEKEIILVSTDSEGLGFMIFNANNATHIVGISLQEDIEGRYNWELYDRGDLVVKLEQILKIVLEALLWKFQIFLKKAHLLEN